MNDIKEHFLNYELSKELKELGFNEPCLAIYDSFDNNLHTWRVPDTLVKSTDIPNSVVAPLISQCKNWFNKKYNIDYEIARDYDFVEETILNIYNFYIIVNNKNHRIISESKDTYKEAELEAIKECIKIIKEKQ